MARTYNVKNLAIPISIYEGLETKMKEEGRLGSFTAYASEILNRYINGSLMSEELLRTKILQQIQETQRPAIDVRGHRPAKEKRGSKHNAA